MPQTIPYDPSLTLGNLVPLQKLDILLEIADAQAPVEAADERFDAASMNLRSLEMMLSDIGNLEIDPGDLRDSMKKAKEQVVDSAKALVAAKVEAMPKINDLRAKLGTISASLESPLDWNKTQIKSDLPIASDSMKLDAQYFSWDENSQSSEATMSRIRSFVTASVDSLGRKVSTEAGMAAQQQTARTRETQSLEGTLVIAATATHKNAALLAPLIIDVDKAIRIWNMIHRSDMIKTNSIASMVEIAREQETKREKSLPLLSGVTYGSSFVGMVHLTKVRDTSSSQKMNSAEFNSQVQASMKASFLGNYAFGAGQNSQFSNDLMNLLSSVELQSTVNLVTMGVIPSIKSNEVQIAVKGFNNFDTNLGEQLATMATDTSGNMETISSQAQEARAAQNMLAVKQTTTTSVLSSLGELDARNDKILNINSMMTAFDAYVDQAANLTCGVPVNYFVKPITRSQLANMWVAKYFPGRYLTTAGDDSTAEDRGGGAGSDPNAQQ